jgi:glycosyltransferase involved in cell wall biosynthesis
MRGNDMSKKVIVISGINFDSGGPLSVYRDCLSFLSTIASSYRIIALVHRRDLYKEFEKDIQIIEFPLSKKSWLMRCFYEYIYFMGLSKKNNPYLWLSLHDITPNVSAIKQAVYCHNPAPFYTMSNKERVLDKGFTLFNLFYILFYKINIKKNDYVIVQQNWLREKFKEIFGVGNVVVAHPKVSAVNIINKETQPKTFIYPTYPRVFKNIELICEAFKSIDDLGAKVYITIDGTENLYAQNIVKKYEMLKSIEFIGIQSRSAIFDYYSKVAALIFPSKLETWGMPMSEFACTGKPIFASDMSFCRETLAGYNNVSFFDPLDAGQLAKLLKMFILDGYFQPENTSFITPEPFASNWEELFKILLREDN